MKKYLFAICLALWSIVLHGGGAVFIVTADLHGEVENFARLAPEIRRYPEAVKIDLGDIVQGNYPAVAGEGFPVLACFNALGYEFLVLGNHDLEFPEETLERWRKFFRGRMLGGQWRLGSFHLPVSAVAECGGYRIGIVALSAAGLKKYAGFWKSLQYIDGNSMVRNAIADLKERSCDAYLLIGHVGAENFGVLAGILRENPEINAVIGSHSHREVPGGRVAGVFAVQPGAHGSSAVKLELVFDEKRRLQYIRSSILHPQETADPEIMAIARKMKDASAGKSGEVLGIFPDAAGFGRQAAEIIRQVSGAEAAVCGVEITAFRRQVTGKVLFDMMPYGNRICLVTLPREKIMGLLRRKRGGRRYFKAGDLSGKYIRVALSDFLLSQITAPPEAEVLEKFERIEIEKALKAGNITDFNAE